MLMLMLATVATVVRAQPLCRPYTVRTGKVFGSMHQVEGDVLFYAYPTTLVLRDLCERNVFLYLGEKIFMSRNSFRTSLPPLTIPKSMAVGVPSVTSAHFTIDSLLVFVVNEKVYTYNYLEDTWKKPAGISTPVSHISGDICCFKTSFCMELSNALFAYLRGGLLPDTNIYVSDNGGSSFTLMESDRLDHLEGTLGGIFNFYSVSQVGILVVKFDMAMFYYTEYPLNQSTGVDFKYNEPLDVIIKPDHRGFLILWSQSGLLVSSSAGQIIDTVRLLEKKTLVTQDLSTTNITIHSVAWDTFELALLTRENHLYYGSQNYLGTDMIKLMDQALWSDGATIFFKDTGILEVLTPVIDPESPAYDFLKCTVNLQAILMTPDLDIDPCNVEVLESTMVDQMFTLDMNSQLKLSALLIPRPGKFPIPLVMISNPHALGFEASISEFGNTFDGNYKYKLEIDLQQQHHLGVADLNFTTSIKRPAISSINVDIADKTLACVDLKPLSTLVSVGCDLTKKIIVQNKISACDMGLLDPVELQRNYTYVIEKEAYRPVSHDAEAQSDLLVYYEYKGLGCPRLVYYDKPWKPVVELWKNGVLEEIMNAEYVITEINGIVTYSYSLTAAKARCRSQPQNWSLFHSGVSFEAKGDEAFLWNRENYASCHEANKDNPLLWPNVEYQILGGPTNNRIIFGQRNGIYTFLLSVVDPYYSYCDLDTVFSVYVYGALPVAKFPPVLSVIFLVVTSLFTMWLFYAIPKFLRTGRGHRLKKFCGWVFFGFLWWVCACGWLQYIVQKCLAFRKAKVTKKASSVLTSQTTETE
ncbi:cation channel sperm-associated auxiliary subunit delta, partial [Acomys russatus]|uniref:cation channel sperm-associated auxiliary subunit delta n=1 Tax=Acomys russatus TaxID=60746 RepID=UPI0021E1CBFA